MAYWTAVELNTSHRLAKAYDKMLVEPLRDPQATEIVERLFCQNGLTDRALK